MASERETLADIVAEIRAYGAQPPPRLMWLEIADRIEAALKRERAAFDCECAGIAELAAKEEAARHTPGNAAAMREAVIKALTLLNVCDWPSGVSLDGVREVIHEIDSVLDKPPRQCDVGTPEEQRRRFNMFCKRTGDRFGESAYCVFSCPCGEVDCKLEWAQMPYEAQEGGAK